MKSGIRIEDHTDRGVLGLYLTENGKDVFSRVGKPVDENGKVNRVLLTGMVSDSVIGASVLFLLGLRETKDPVE